MLLIQKKFVFFGWLFSNMSLGFAIKFYLQMSSAAGKTPAPGQAVYSASKYALNGYFHTLRSEVFYNFFLEGKIKTCALAIN